MILPKISFYILLLSVAFAQECNMSQSDDEDAIGCETSLMNLNLYLSDKLIRMEGKRDTWNAVVFEIVEQLFRVQNFVIEFVNKYVSWREKCTVTPDTRKHPLEPLSSASGVFANFVN
ncbi:hypothetical protein BDR06DRAFT_973370 [Suillus hirtellus]|nr:hypothetical protein BDR06DRAFT_973370 [Suillus hirtellus]